MPAATVPGRPGAILWAGVWFALLAGFTETGLLLARRLDGRFIHRSRDFLRTTPAGYLLLFALPVLLIWFLHRRGWIGVQLAITLLATGAFASVSMVLLGGKVHPAALLLLALGAGVQVGRLAQRRLDSFSRLVRRTTPFLVMVFLLLGIGTWTTDAGSRDDP